MLYIVHCLRYIWYTRRFGSWFYSRLQAVTQIKHRPIWREKISRPTTSKWTQSYISQANLPQHTILLVHLLSSLATVFHTETSVHSENWGFQSGKNVLWFYIISIIMVDLYPAEWSGTFLRNVGYHLQDYTASQPRNTEFRSREVTTPASYSRSLVQISIPRPHILTEVIWGLVRSLQASVMIVP
jgi:hypothetical protein